jgi:putative ABC transport system permease protein
VLRRVCFWTLFALAIAAPLSSADSALPEILLSRQIMEQTGVHVGDVVTLAADEAGRRSEKFRVAGTYEPTPNPLRFSAKQLEARLHLPDVIRLTEAADSPESSESVTALNLTLATRGDSAAVTAAIDARAPGLFAHPTSTEGDEGETFRVIDRFHRAIAVVTVFGSTAFLLALMVIRAEERKDIVGILRLIGIPPRTIFTEVLLEGLLIATGGAIFGAIVAWIGEFGVNRFFQWRYDTTLVFAQVTPAIVLQSIAFAVPLGVVAGVAASWTLLGREVVSLIRR